MIKGKKGVTLPVEFLVRILFMIFLVLVVFTIGKEAGKYIFAGFFGTDLEKNFNEFVDEMNKPFEANVPSRQAFINLDSNTAIIGFSTTADGFRCIGCGSSDITSYFEKPNNNECNSKSCVCLCPKSLQIGQLTPYKMQCDKIKCRSLNKDLAEMVELKDYIEKVEKENSVEYSFLRNAKWSGGFLFERHFRATFVSNGLPQPLSNRFSVYVNKGEGNLLIICPGPDCKYSLKIEQKMGVPPEICNIMDDCFTSLGMQTQKAPPYNYCKPGIRPVTRTHSKEACEKIMGCVQQNPKIKTQGKCSLMGGFYELSFLP